MLNLLFGAIAVPPCLMAGLMSMDSPQAQHSVGAHIACYSILSFPLVCWACSFWAPSLTDSRPKAAIFLSLLPMVVAAAFFGHLHLLLWLDSINSPAETTP